MNGAEHRPLAAAAADMRMTSALVSGGAALYAIGLALLAWSRYPFRLGDQGGIVSWVTVHDYPIHQETIALMAGVAASAAGVVLGQRGWRALAAALRRAAGLEVRPALRLAGVGVAATGSALLPIAAGAWTFAGLAAMPLACAVAALGAGFALRGAAPIRARLDAPIAVGASDGDAPAPWSATRRLVLLVVAPALVYVLLYDAGDIFLPPIDPLHEGERLAHVTALRHGAVPYRDFFVQHGLGQDVLKAWLADATLDGTVYAQRLVDRALRPLGGVAVYLLGLAIFRSWVTALLLVVVVTAGRLDVHDRLVLGLLAVAALAHGWRSANRGASDLALPAPRWAALAGALSGVAFWYSTEIGLYALAACGLSLGAGALVARGSPAERLAPLVGLGLGALAGLAPIALALAARGALPDLVKNTWLQLTLQRIVWGLPYPALDESLAAVRSPAALLTFLQSPTFEFYLPIAIVLAAVGALTHGILRDGRPRAARDTPLALLTLYAVLLLVSALGRSDYRHLMYATAPAYALLLVAFEAGARRAARALGRRDYARAAPAALAACAFALYWQATHDWLGTHTRAVLRLVGGYTLPRTDLPTTWAPLGAMGDAGEPQRRLEAIAAFVQEETEPGEAFYDFTNQAVFFFLADRPSASRYVYAAYAPTPALEAEVVAELEARRTKLVLYRAGGPADSLDGVPVARRHPTIDRYIRANYVPARRVGGVLFMRRR